jgi:hypothetical protein
MPIYWEKNAARVQEANSDTREDDDECEIHNPHMKNDEDKKQIMNPTMQTNFIFNLQINNNYNSAKFGMQRCKDDMSGVSIKLATVFIRS